MRSRSFFVLVSIFVFAGFGAAQRSVTNADLESYRDQRIRAKADLQQNYDRLSFPSPAELARREQERNRKIDQLTSTLRQESLEETRMYRQYETATAPHRVIVEQPQQEDGEGTNSEQYPNYPSYTYGYPGYNGYPDIFGVPRRYDPFGRRPRLGYPSGGVYWPY